MHTSATFTSHSVRTAVLVALGVEFTHTHGLEYAKALLEMLGADDDTVRQLVQKVVAERCAFRR